MMFKKSLLLKLESIKMVLFSYFFIESLSYKYYNLNLPETQEHNFHLLDEQSIHYKIGFSENKGAKKTSIFYNGFSTALPFCLSVCLFLFCFFFRYFELFFILHYPVT